MKYLLYTIPFFVLLLFTQCRKDPYYYCDIHPDECTKMQRIKDHYYFKTGSWWVYDEINTHQRDSQWVASDWLSDNHKEFDMVIKSTLDDYDRHRWTHLLTYGENNNTILKKRAAYIERSKGKAGDFVGTSFIGIFYPVTGDSVGNYGGGGYPSETYRGILKIIDILDSYSESGKDYSNIIVISDEFNLSENSQPTVHYYAEGVGLIRKELLDSNQIWVLSDYEVEQ
ncbi:MAG: hypothetical protein ACWA41_02370 [Putridiphycobacter sp.]